MANALQREVSCHSHLGVQFRNMRGNSHLTTALLGGGWVPEISKSFPHWQPAPRWRLLPYLANPGNPVMKPHAEKGNRHLSHWINSKKREGRGGENCLYNELPLQTMIKVHAQSTSKNASNAEYMEFQHAYMQKTLDYYGMLMLLTLLNCIWLHIRFIISANSIL